MSSEFSWKPANSRRAAGLPEALQKLQRCFAEVVAEISDQLGRAPNASEVATTLRVEREAVIDLIVATEISESAAAGKPQGAPRSNGRASREMTLGLDSADCPEHHRICFDALRDDERTALLLRIVKSLSVTEIARHLDRSPADVYQLLLTALHHLRHT